MRTSERVLAIVTFLLLSANAWAQSSAATQPLTAVERAALFPSRNLIEQGRTVAEAACSRCHGMDGLSMNEQLPNLAGQRTVYLYRVIRAYQNGHRVDDSMGHASGFLNDEGMMSVAAFYASLPPANPAPQDQDAVTEPELADDPFSDVRGAMKKCVKCHGESGNSTTSGIPNLTAQDTEYFKTSMQAYANGERAHRIMKKLAGSLDEPTLTKMGVYYAVQQPVRSETRGDGNELSGRKLAEECAACHGEDGNASKSDTPSLAGQDARYLVKASNEYLHGERKDESMFKSLEGLSEKEIQDLATFYAAREPTQRNIRTPLTSGEWIGRCERCHGMDGNSTDPRFPMLAGQNRGYLAKSLHAYAGNVRDNSTMHAMSNPLSESDIETIATYFASREPKSVVYLELPCTESGSE